MDMVTGVGLSGTGREAGTRGKDGVPGRRRQKGSDRAGLGVRKGVGDIKQGG